MSLKAFLKSKKFALHLFLVVIVVALLIYLTMLFLKVYTHHGKTLPVPDLMGLTESEVQYEIKEDKLRYIIIDSVFTADVIPGTVIAQQPKANYRVKQNRTIYLTIAAISPEKVLLPEIVNWSVREAQSRLENAGLKLGKVKYVPSEFNKLVLGKSLNGVSLPDDTMLVKGTAVDLIVGQGLSNEVTEVPNLLGADIQSAKDMLYNVGLNVGAVIYDASFQTAEDSIMAIVFRQNPEGDCDKTIAVGTSVDLWITVDQEKIDIVTEKEF